MQTVSVGSEAPRASTAATDAATTKNTLVAFRVVKAESIKSAVKTFIMLAVYLFVSGMVMQALEPDFTHIDAVYFGMATMSTVGYGDLSPSTDGARVFAVFMIMFGIVFVFASVAGLISEFTAPLTRRGRDLLERAFPRVGVDLDGSGEFDFYQPRHPFLYYSKNLLPSLVLTIFLQLVSAGIFYAIDPSHAYGLWLYHCYVTATTVGYGDVPNVTQGGRLWSSFHILLSVAMLGELISTFDELRAERAKIFARIKMLTTRLNAEMLDGLLEHAVNLRPRIKRDGQGLTELEFVIAMLLELDVVQLDQVAPFVKQFRLLDVDGNSRLGRDDLEATKDKSLADLQAASRERMNDPAFKENMSVGARVGLTIGRQQSSGALQAASV